MEAELSGELDGDSPNGNRILAIIAAYVFLFYQLGSGRGQDELDDADMEIINSVLDQARASIEIIITRHASGIDMTPTINRILNRAQSVYWAGLVRNGADEEKLTWVLGLTEEHCSDCSGFSGQTKTRKEWRDGGLLPQDPGLECTGRYCQCELVAAQE